MIKAAYRLSSPQGLGFLHFQPGDDLPEEDVDEILSREDTFCKFSMDYVLGRAVKLGVYKRDDDRLYIRKNWFDHSPEQLTELLEASKPDVTA